MDIVDDPQFFVEVIEKQEEKKEILEKKETKEMEEDWRLYTLKGKHPDAGLIGLLRVARRR